MWYKVVIRRDGAVASCVQQSESFEDGSSVFYVEADSKEDAIAKAKRIKLDRKTHQRQKLTRLGLCQDCRRPSRPGKIRCSDCADKSAERHRLKKEGVFVPKTPAEISQIHKGRARCSTERKVALMDCRNAFLTMNKVTFVKWLNSQINNEDALSGTPAAYATGGM